MPRDDRQWKEQQDRLSAAEERERHTSGLSELMPWPVEKAMRQPTQEEREFLDECERNRPKIVQEFDDYLKNKNFQPLSRLERSAVSSFWLWLQQREKKSA